MKRFISLLRFTAQGAKAMKKSPTRAAAFAKAAKRAGVKVEGEYWTVGRYDGVLILAARDEHDVLRLLAHLAEAGNVQSETLIAYDSAEFGAILRN